MYRARSTPYGDIYTIPTTTVDNIANRFVLEQKQRQVQQASESKALDDMFGKNISGMRDEDIPEYTQAYQDYKQAKIGLLNNNKLSGNARIQAELDAQGKLAKTFQILNNSKETQKGLLDIKKRVDNKPDDHVDDAFAMIGAANGVPSSQLHTLTRPDPNGEIDPSTGKVKIVPYDATDYNNYLDRGNVKDWEQVAKTSLGDYKDIDPIKEDYKDKSGLVLGQTVTPIKSTISPTAYMANMSKYIYSGVGRMKHYTNTFKQIYTDDKAQQIASEYYDNAKNNPLWKQAWGENGLAIPPEALLNPNTRYLALNAMENAINYPPKLGKPSNVPNPVNVAASKRAANMEDWSIKNSITSRQKDNRTPQGTNTPTTTGNAFDEIGGVRDLEMKKGGVLKGRISQGIVYDEKGGMYNGEVPIPREYLPANVTTALESGKIKIPREVRAVVKDGVVQSIITPNGEISRLALENLQKNVNKEPAKAAQPQYGSKNKPIKKVTDANLLKQLNEQK